MIVTGAYPLSRFPGGSRGPEPKATHLNYWTPAFAGEGLRRRMGSE
jgi:hypothetical protein